MGADTGAKGVILITDANFGEPDLEEDLVRAAGYRLEVADCRSEEDVIAAVTAVEPVALLVQYAPITHRVLDASPSVRASRATDPRSRRNLTSSIGFPVLIVVRGCNAE